MSADERARALAEPAGDYLDQRQRWRERTLQGLLLSTFLVTSVAGLWFLITPGSVQSLAHVLGVATLLLAGLLTLRRRVPFALRAGAYLSTLFSACAVSMLSVGFNPNGPVGFAAVAVAAALLFGRRAALLVVAAGCLVVMGVSFAHHVRLLPHVSSWTEVLDSARLSNGARVTAIFGLLATSSVVGVSYLLERTEHVLLQQADALRALRHEQLEKEQLRSDLVLREAQLHKARELETLGRLAGSMAHDFNNALLVIWASLDELTQRGHQRESREAAVSALRTAAEQATATTRSLRAFGPSAPRRPTLLPLSAVIARAKASLARVLPPNIAIELDLQVQASVAADEGELLRVLTNLALNARDAMRDGGRLVLRLRPAAEAEQQRMPPGGKWIALDVADTGVGMTEAVKERLFEPFFTTKALGGTGLGLATVRDLARKHGGDVTVVSELGKGTTVTLFWPVASASTAALLSPAGCPSGAGQVVLVVDDDTAVLAALSKTLSGAGFSVLEATNAALGIEVLRRGKLNVHMLCTDWMMPGRPVRELIQEFRRTHGGPVLICSGHAPEETGMSLELADEFLSKPFKGDELVRKVSSLLDDRGAAQAAAR